jgi:hypothetical protein
MLQEKYFTIIFKIIQYNLAVSVQSPNDSKYILECSRKYTLFTCFEHIFMKWQEYSGMYFSHECSGNFPSNIYK